MGRLLPLLALLLIACPTEDDPGDVILWDDDDSAAPTDDDDAIDDDDAMGPDRSGILWLLDRQDQITAEEANDRVFAAATFAQLPQEPMDDYAVYLGLPLPGLLLHPDLAPVFEDGEGCLPIASTDGWASLAGSDDVGDKIQLVSAAGAELDVALEDGIYRLETDGPPAEDSWSLELDGGADWPGSETPDLLELPPRLEGTAPTPGNLGGLSPILVGWIPAETAGVEVMLVRYDSPADTSHWTGVRCLAEDDGVFTVDASALAASGTGDVQVSFARAHWEVAPAVPAEGRPAMHAGAITAVSFRMTVGGR